MYMPMKAGLVSVALALSVSLAAPASAADLGGRRSMKDGWVPAAPAHAAAGPCYLRADVGYAWSNSADANFVGNAVDPNVRNIAIDDGALLEAGFGCGSGSRGLRGEAVFGVRQEREFHGDVDIVIAGLPVDPPITTSLRSYTLMFNGYYDFGKFGGFVPYVGAGVGVALHDMDGIRIDDPSTPNVIRGDDNVSFAWALMAGVAYQLTDRAILDVGYRFSDLGSARGGRVDSAGAVNPRLEIDDMRSHEVKVGLRYHFGAAEPAVFAPMK